MRTPSLPFPHKPTPCPRNAHCGWSDYRIRSPFPATHRPNDLPSDLSAFACAYQRLFGRPSAVSPPRTPSPSPPYPVLLSFASLASQLPHVGNLQLGNRNEGLLNLVGSLALGSLGQARLRPSTSPPLRCRINDLILALLLLPSFWCVHNGWRASPQAWNCCNSPPSSRCDQIARYPTERNRLCDHHIAS